MARRNKIRAQVHYEGLSGNNTARHAVVEAEEKYELDITDILNKLKNDFGYQYAVYYSETGMQFCVAMDDYADYKWFMERWKSERKVYEKGEQIL